MTLPENFAFVDIETSGGSALYDRIIEIGIVRVEKGKLVKTYQTLINPDCFVSPFIENMTGITQKELEIAPSFYDVKDEILELLSDCTFVAHNVRFDYGFLRGEFKRNLVNFNAKQLCTVKLSRALFPEYKHHNLDALISRFGFDCKNRHRAFDDALVLWKFMQVVQNQFSADLIARVVSDVMKRPSRPMQITEETLDSLPESPGVYIFHDSAGAPLYVGKSINIRDRVLSHFAADTESTKERELSEQTHTIETIVTAGELSALFLESQLVKDMQPLYNRKLRRQRKLSVLVKKTLENGYDTVEFNQLDEVTVADLPRILAIVKSKKQATTLLREIARKNSLCPKLLNTESTRTSCFSYRLGWCKGACVEREQPLTYNLRFLMGFSEYKIKKWPFEGAIMITENNTMDDKSTSFVIDNWCYLGSCNRENSCDLSQDYIFDYDCYKILVQYLKNPAHYKNIKALSHSQSQLFFSAPR